MTSRLQNRRDTAANWTSNNPTLAAGEIGLETDSSRYKIGNGSTAWNSLAYAYIGNNVSINAQTGTSYTPVLNDSASLVTLNNASAISVTIPTDASVNFQIGSQLNFAWVTGAGQPTISAATPATTTILSTGGTSTAPKLRAVNASATCIKILENTWLVVGDVS